MAFLKMILSINVIISHTFFNLNFHYNDNIMKISNIEKYIYFYYINNKHIIYHAVILNFFLWSILIIKF